MGITPDAYIPVNTGVTRADNIPSSYKPNVMRRDLFLYSSFVFLLIFLTNCTDGRPESAINRPVRIHIVCHPGFIESNKSIHDENFTLSINCEIHVRSGSSYAPSITLPSTSGWWFNICDIDHTWIEAPSGEIKHFKIFVSGRKIGALSLPNVDIGKLKDDLFIQLTGDGDVRFSYEKHHDMQGKSFR
jgi:hypothetical protein